MWNATANATPPADPPDLRRLLFAAVDRGDHDELVRLCLGHAETILASFPAWQADVASATAAEAEAEAGPDGDAAGDAADAAGERYVGGLYAVAKVFANHLGRVEPLQRLLGPDGQDTRIARWEQVLSAAMALIRQGQYADAERRLSDQLIDARGLRGHGHLHLQATTHWYLSQSHWLRRDRDGAVGHAERSLRITRHIRDDPTYVRRYLAHLCSVHRYFGEAAAAAAFADEAADALVAADATDEARVYRRQAELLRRGEPPVRVVAWRGSARYELDELDWSHGPGGLRLALERNRPGFQVTDLLVQQGEALWRQGRLDDAAAAFRQAAAADPYDPDPLVHLGRAMLAAGRYVEAADAFGRADELAPDWYGCRTGSWAARRLMEGRYPPEVLLPLAGLGLAGGEANGNDGAEDGDPKPAGPDGWLELSDQVAERFPDLALAHLHHGTALRDAGRPADAETALRRGLAANADADEAVRTRIFMDLALLQSAGDERTRLMRAAAGCGGDPAAAAFADLCVRFGW